MICFSEKHYVSCLLGGAIGDALGSDIEFMDITAIRKLHGEQGITEMCEQEFTDDTQMTLFTAEALVRFHLQSERSDLNLQTSFHHAYLRWLYTQDEKIAPSLRRGWLLQQAGLFVQRAPGLTCLKALRSGKMGTRNYAINDSKGCGGVMRVAPVGLYFYQDPEKAFRMAADAAAITHSHVSGYLSAGYFAALIAFLVQGKALDKSAQEVLDLLKAYPKHDEVLTHVDRALNMAAGGMEVTPERLEKMGDNWPGAVGEEALAMSLFCALSFPEDYSAGVLAAVNHSGDSDSTGIITGQILGLVNGLDAVPKEWIGRLKMADVIHMIARDLYTVCTKTEGLTMDLVQRYA